MEGKRRSDSTREADESRSKEKQIDEISNYYITSQCISVLLSNIIIGE